MKKLVAYFSPTGTTAKAARALAEAADSDLFEIKPSAPYTRADLDWTNPRSRSSVEMNNSDSRPAIAGKLDNMGEYDVIFLGFPIWWYTAPTIINTFLESYDLSGKTIVTFATSGGSGMENVSESLSASCRGAKLVIGSMFKGGASSKQMQDWLTSLDI